MIIRPVEGRNWRRLVAGGRRSRRSVAAAERDGSTMGLLAAFAQLRRNGPSGSEGAAAPRTHPTAQLGTLPVGGWLSQAVLSQTSGRPGR